MGDYEASCTVDVAWNVLWDYLSDVKRLPEYLPNIEEAHRLPGAHPHVEPYQLGGPADTGIEPVDVDVHPDAGQEIHERGWIEVVEHGHKLRWGAAGPNQYHGELAVAFVADTTSLLTVRLHTEHTGGPDVERELEESLGLIKESAEHRHPPEAGEPEA